MKILYSVQRYGEQIVGGSETACRLFAEHLVQRGHEVDVLTSCAVSYVDWSDHYKPGAEVLNGVTVVRLPVEHTRDAESFTAMHQKLMENVEQASLEEQHQWLREMGPVLEGQTRWLRENASKYDVVIFMTYLYPTTVFGLSATMGLVPTILQPTAHDEPPAHLPIYKSLFKMANSFLFLTEEEKELVTDLYGVGQDGQVAGIGIDTENKSVAADTFRTKFDLGIDPYLIYVGRIDVFKGVSEMIRFFVEFKGRHPGNLRLVLTGEQIMELPEHEDIVYVGFLDDELKKSAIEGSVALVQPSPYESFSIVLCEAWMQERPVLVQAWSEVMKGQVTRSNGGLYYDGVLEFDACLQFLIEHPDRAREFGKSGKKYVDMMYSWDSVLNKVELSIDQAINNFNSKEKINYAQ
jgi:glycosyltransferase involved in cell wall biosynthesis